MLALKELKYVSRKSNSEIIVMRGKENLLEKMITENLNFLSFFFFPSCQFRLVQNGKML